MLRPLALDLWVAEAPLRWLGVKLGRRMTVIRLSRGELLIHSPAPLTAELRDALAELGEVRFVVPASRFHGHRYMEHYRAAYPKVELFAAPGLERRRGDLSFDGQLGDGPDPRWREDVDQLAFPGSRFLTEIVFLPRSSGSLVLGDLCMNLGPDMPLLSRAYVRLDGVAGHFAMPHTIRLTVRKPQVRPARNGANAQAGLRPRRDWPRLRGRRGRKPSVRRGNGLASARSVAHRSTRTRCRRPGVRLDEVDSPHRTLMKRWVIAEVSRKRTTDFQIAASGSNHPVRPRASFTSANPFGILRRASPELDVVDQRLDTCRRLRHEAPQVL
jgi:hypothetical protein